MGISLGWQQAVEDLAGDNKEIREQLRGIAWWFPTVAMMRNHALGLVKRSLDPRQRTRWWMYRSSKMMSPQPNPTRLASRTESVTDVVPIIPAPVNTTYWDRKNPTVIFPYNCERDSEPSRVTEV
ncbi:hypothetical protein ZWY2020_052721 [Hordeum vulgare]|nr:hypothetical protein ZWY2020_052721 [Hordeum vulgare]